MMWVRSNRGNIITAVLVVVAGLFLGLMVYHNSYYADAAIGGIGNLGDSKVQGEHKHNLSMNGPGPIKAASETEICIFCHTPHRAIVEAASGAPLFNAPLWNHELTTQSFYNVKIPGVNVTDPITNTTIGNISLLVTPLDEPDGASRLCLSCHDGTVAIGAVNSRLSDIEMEDTVCLEDDGSMDEDCAGYRGTDLTDHHVVSVPMNQALLSASNSACGITNTTKLRFPWDDSLPLDTRDQVLLRPTAAEYPEGNKGIPTPTGSKYTIFAEYNYGVQCSSCHDPHLWHTRTIYGNKISCNFLVNDACADKEAGDDDPLDIDPLCTACHMDCSE